MLGGRPPHDFAISTSAGELVWLRKFAKISLSVLYSETLWPGEEVEFIGEWEQVDNRGEPVPPGTHVVSGILEMNQPETLVTPPHELEALT